MVDGTLDMESFRYYVVQDALYLGDFADCLQRLSKGAENEHDAKRLEAFAKGAQEAEMELHNSFFAEWDISAEGVEQMPNTLLYTSYMKRIVATRCHAEGLAALLPCFWVYMHVGKQMLQLRKDLGDSVTRCPQFDAWIDMYGGDDFEKEVRDYIQMCDEAAKTQMLLHSRKWKSTLSCLARSNTCFGIKHRIECSGLTLLWLIKLVQVKRYRIESSWIMK